MFFQDLWNLTVFFIGCVDIPTSCALLNKAERKHYNSNINLAKGEERSPDFGANPPHFGEKQLATAEEQEMIDLKDRNGPHINFHYFLPYTSKMRTHHPATSTVCDRCNVSDRAAAAITWAVL